MAFNTSMEDYLIKVCDVGFKEERITRNVFVLVCDSNGKWLKNFYVFCVHLFY
jgi:hypothetical protein